jgi:NTE family protein
MIRDIVLSGGGVKGITFIGAIKFLDEQNMLNNIQSYTGSSFGALLSCMLIIGYNPMELEDFVIKFNFKNLQNIEIENFLTHYGIDNGNLLLIALRCMFIQRSIDIDITFKELYNNTYKKLTVTSVCVEERKVIYFNHINTPNMKVLLALRMSISIPFFYTPVCYKDKHYIDGGILDNFPLHLFSKKDNRVLGIRINDRQQSIDNIEDYTISIIQMLIGQIDKLKTFEKDHRVIEISTEDIHVIQFDLDNEKKRKLIDIGYDICKNYLKKNL